MQRQVIHVLLIEDSPDDALIIQELLADSRQAVFEVEHVEWLAAAIARLAPTNDGVRTAGDEARPEVLVIVELSVVGNPTGLIVVGHGLRARG